MSENAVLIHPLDSEMLVAWQAQAGPRERHWVDTCGFTAKPGEHCLIPDSDGTLAQVVAGIDDPLDPWSLAHLPDQLPEGQYRLAGEWSAEQQHSLALGFQLARYRFDRYRDNPAPRVDLLLDADRAEQVGRMANAVNRVRDLVNTPTEDMGPVQMSELMAQLADQHGARFQEIVGDALLTEKLPAIHAVGRAAAQAPRLLIIDWGKDHHPAVTLVGKGVCFDTGGLNLKSAAGMRIMKKDMGGGAHVIALAEAIMDAGLPVRLKVLVPAVENSVAGNAYRPGDIIPTRAGLSVEIGNTDAEGRVVLCDALALACESKPELLIDFATLTGAARVALGPDLPPLFGNDQALVNDLLEASSAVRDPLWQMPLYDDYDSYLDSPIADLSNIADSPFGGCITAALYLRRFVTPETPWCHLDTYAWNRSSRPGRPVGGEAMGLRAVYHYLQRRYGQP